MTPCVAKKFACYLRSTRAVSALEYALLLGVVATAVAAALVTLGDEIEDALDSMGDEVEEAVEAVED